MLNGTIYYFTEKKERIESNSKKSVVLITLWVYIVQAIYDITFHAKCLVTTEYEYYQRYKKNDLCHHLNEFPDIRK